MSEAPASTLASWRPEDPRSIPGDPWAHRPKLEVRTSGERRRFRLGVLGRAGLVTPHFGYLDLLWIPGQFAVLLAGLCVMYEARVPAPIHRFLARLVDYQTRVFAYLFLAADPFPGFTTNTSYPFGADSAPPQRHSRWRAFFYPLFLLLLLLPSLLACLALVLIAPVGWLWAIVFGRVPRWYQRSATWLVAYLAQVMAFGCFVTDRLPSRPRKVIALGAWERTPLPEPPPSPAPLPRLARAGVGLCVLAIAAAAVVAGALLWRTTVPTGLSLPHLDAAKYLDWEVLQNAGPSRTSNRWFAASQLAGLVALSLFAWRGMRWARHSAAGPIGTGVFVAMLGLLCAGLAGAPFLALAVTSMPDTVDSDPAWLIVPLQVVGPLGTAAIAAAVAMGIARKLPRGVWLVAPAALAVLVAGSVVLAAPLLTSGEDKLDDPVLLADARQLAAREGIPNAKIEVIDERDEPGDTRTPTNAFAVGGVGTSEVVLLGSPRTRRQVRVILGHEIGHIARHHTWKAAGWQALFLLLAAGAVGLVLRRRSLYDPRVIPVALLVFSLAALAWRPLDTAASRRYESEADWMALNATRDPKADIDLMEVLALENGAPPRDDGVGRALIDDHPDIMSRIEMAVAWRRLHPARQKKS